RLAARAAQIGVAIPPASVDALETYFFLLARWNETVNLTALPLDPPRDNTFDRLLLEPIAAADRIQPSTNPRSAVPIWVDLGSGGGSPAIPLKILRPHWVLTMVEARERKTAFLREAVRALQLGNVDVRNVRFEELEGPDGSVDLVSVRAVRLDASLEHVATRLLTATGLLALFGSGDVIMNGFSPPYTAQLTPATELTVLRRVPRGTNSVDGDR